MSECLLAVPGMGAVWSQNKRVRQVMGFFPECLVQAWAAELSTLKMAASGVSASHVVDEFNPYVLGSNQAGDERLGRTLNDVQGRMVQWIVATPPEQIAAAHERNWLLRWDEVQRARLEWRSMSGKARLTLQRTDGEELVLVAGGERAKPRFAMIERALGMSQVAARVEVGRRP